MNVNFTLGPVRVMGPLDCSSIHLVVNLFPFFFFLKLPPP